MIRLALLTLIFAILAGGRPWLFPAGGKFWFDVLEHPQRRTFGRLGSSSVR